MRLEDGRREQSRRPLLSPSDRHVLIVALIIIGIGTGVLLYFSTPLADALSQRMMNLETKRSLVSD